MTPDQGTKARELNFAIRYLTKYTYDADIVDNLNALRVRAGGQRAPARR